MAYQYYDNFTTTLAGSYTAGAATMSLTAIPAGAAAIGSTDSWDILVDTERLRVTGPATGAGPYTVSVSTLTGSSAHSAGATVTAVLDAAMLTGGFARRDQGETMAGPLTVQSGLTVTGTLTAPTLAAPVTVTGALTTQGALTIPPSAAAAPAPSSYGSTLVKIAETVVGTVTPSVTFSSIPQGYRSLRMQWIARGDASASASDINLQFNGDLGANYGYMQLYGLNNTANSSTAAWGQTFIQIGRMPAASAQALWASTATLEIPFYAQTSWAKTCVATTLDFETTATTAEYLLVRGGLWGSVAAITSITLTAAVGNFVAGSIFALYGIP